MASSLFPLLFLLSSGPPEPGDIEVWRELTGRALQLRSAGRLRESESINRQALAGLARTVGQHHIEYAVALNNLGRVRAAMGDWKTAQRLHEEALVRIERAVGPDHALVAKAAANLADVLEGRKRFHEAVPMLERALALEEALPGGGDPRRVAEHLERLAGMEYKRNRSPQAISHQERAFALREAGSVEAAVCASNLGALYFHVNRFDAAALQFSNAVPALQTHWGVDSPRLLHALGLWEQSLLRLENFAEAARLEAQSIRIQVRQALR